MKANEKRLLRFGSSLEEHRKSTSKNREYRILVPIQEVDGVVSSTVDCNSTENINQNDC